VKLAHLGEKPGGGGAQRGAVVVWNLTHVALEQRNELSNGSSFSHRPL